MSVTVLIQQAMEILGQVAKEQLPTSTVHYNRALKALVTGKQFDKLQEVCMYVYMYVM